MYVPKVFAHDDRASLHALMRANNFALLLTATGGLVGTHLPFVLDTDNGRDVLLGHMARANPHWQAFDGKTEAMAVFLGPHAYISPSWYRAKEAVPTWNYAAVHAYGRPTIIEARDQIVTLLRRLVGQHETAATGPWPMERLSPAFLDRMLGGVVAFALPIERLEGKFKISQNRPADEIPGIIAALHRSDDAGARAMAALMARQFPDSGSGPA
jgi:transcriptional regulator